MFILYAPLRVLKNKTKYSPVNLNVYRNTHYFTNNTMKKNYREIMKQQILTLPQFDCIKVEYELNPKTKRLSDLDNMLSIQSKFFLDALVTFKRIPDDNFLCVPEEVFKLGKVNKDNPHVKITITKIRKIEWN